MTTTKRDHVIECARELFEREGFHATGVDRILERAGVAKMTLYNNFGSKERLIVEVLEESSKAMIERLASFARKAGPDPYDQILGIFHALGAWYADPEFCGCMFQAAVAEYPNPDDTVAIAARAHQERVQDLFSDLCEAAELADPDSLSRRLALLASGATCVARQSRSRTPADDALGVAEVLLERAAHPPTDRG
mgnify:CR=1 FL=1